MKAPERIKIISISDVERAKELSRQRDLYALQSGLKSREQLRKENSIFYGCKVKVYYA